MGPLSIDFPELFREVRVADSKKETSPRARARALKKRGDIEGARALIRETLEAATDPLEKAKLEADLNELPASTEGLETQELDPAPLRPPPLPDEDGIVGKSAATVKLRKQIQKAASTHAPILIEGESGTGKELVARAIHRRSSRAAEPFVAVNAAALAPGVVEAELFGHAEGAFTGATSAREGLLAQAKAGTVLLDGIEEMPLDVQAKLLRALEGGEVRPVGGGAPIKLEARFITTARRSLAALVKEGKFREDLLYRLNVLTIPVASLRERRDDIPLLIDFLIAKHVPDGKSVRVAESALAKLEAYPWPGNVRELENELRRLIVLAVDKIDEQTLAPAIRSGRAAERPDLSTGLYERLRGRSMDEIERAAIMSALRATANNRSAAARMLQVSRRALYDKMKRLGIAEA